MFTVRFINTGNVTTGFSSLKKAFEYGKKCCFEFVVSDEYGAVLAWSPIGGCREYRSITKAGELRADSPRQEGAR